MNVNVSNLKTELNELNNLLEEYEDNYLNYYNTISSFSFFWRDGNSIHFFSTVEREKSKVRQTFEELNDIKNIYAYLLDKYSVFGKKVYVVLKEKDNIIANFDNYLNAINNIIRDYNNLDLSFCYRERYIIRKQLTKLIKNRDTVQNAKNKVKNIFNRIIEIEKEVSVRISRIDVQFLKESNYKSRNSPASTVKNVMDKVKVDNGISKISMYRRVESVNFDSIKSQLKSLEKVYDTDNTKKLVNLHSEIYNKLRIILNIHKGNILILKENLEKYRNTEIKVEKMFDDIV